MTQAEANTHFQEQINRAKRLAVDLADFAHSFDNDDDVTGEMVDNFCSQLDDYEVDIHSISDDTYTIQDDGIEDGEDVDE